MSWIKIQNGLVTNKKTARLSSKMKWSKVNTVGFMVSFWVWAIENCEDGMMGDISDSDLAFAVGEPEEKMGGIVKALTEAGLVDEAPLRIHDWPEHQKEFLRGKYKNNPEKFAAMQDLYRSKSGVSPEFSSTERKKERKRDKEGEVGKPPTIQEVKAWAEAEKIPTDTEKFFYFYESKGWAGVVDWKAALKYWKATDHKDKQVAPSPTKKNPVYDDSWEKDSKRRNDWHSAHLKGGKCSFCGGDVPEIDICHCKEYTDAFNKFCGEVPC